MTAIKPVIGITVSQADGRLSLGCGCEKAIVAAGGIPLPLPIHLEPSDAAAVLACCDGILFSGGVDLDPLYYGEEVLLACGAIDTERDVIEKAYFEAARARHLPIFGICRGHQILNVFLGGDLYQDIDTQFKRENALQHRSQGPSDSLLHSIHPIENTLLAEISQKDTLRVTSTHHQAIRRVASCLKVGAYSSDGIVEALESTNEDFLLSVQWHPELLWPKDPAALALFQRLVAESAAHHRKENT